MAKDIRFENDKIYIGKTAYPQTLKYEVDTYSTAQKMFQFKDKNLRSSIADTFVRGNHAVLIRWLCQMLIKDGIKPDDCEIILYRYSLLLIYTFISSSNSSIVTSEIEQLLNDINISSLSNKLEVKSNNTNIIKLFVDLYNKDFENNKFEDYISDFSKELGSLKTKKDKSFNQYKDDIINSIKEDYYFFLPYKNQYDKKYGVFSDYSSFDRMISDFISEDTSISYELDFKTNSNFESFGKSINVDVITGDQKNYFTKLVGSYMALIIYKLFESSSFEELKEKKEVQLNNLTFSIINIFNFDASGNSKYFYDSFNFLKQNKDENGIFVKDSYIFDLNNIKEPFEFDFNYFEEKYHIIIDKGLIEIN